MINNIIVSICNDAILEAGNSATINSLSDKHYFAKVYAPKCSSSKYIFN